MTIVFADYERVDEWMLKFVLSIFLADYRFDRV